MITVIPHNLIYYIVHIIRIPHVYVSLSVVFLVISFPEFVSDPKSF